MGALDWLNQAFRSAGDWVQQKVIRPLSSGVDWVNQNVVQPAAGALKNLPVVGSVAQAVGQAGNAVSNIGQMAAGKRQFNLGEALGNVQDAAGGGRAVYDAIQKRRKVA